MRPLRFVALLMLAASGLFAADPLPAPWKDQDIGVGKKPGTAGFDAGVFTLQGAGNILGVADGCHIAWQPLLGDGELVARVTAVENTAPHAKASVCIRESLEAGARHATLVVTPADGALLLFREQVGGKTPNKLTGKDKGRFPNWLKIVRRGKEFSGYESGDGQTWTLVGKVDLEIGNDAVAGLCASSHLDTTLCQASFDHVKLTVGPAPEK